VRNAALSFHWFAGIWVFHLLRGELRTALKRAEDMLRMAEQTQNKIFLLSSHMAMALSLFYQGHSQRAHEHCQQALPHYDLDYHRTTTAYFGGDPAVLTYCYDSHALWFLGFPETADTAIENALALVKKLGSPFNKAACYVLASMYYAHRLDGPKALEMAAAALDISTEGGFLQWVACARFLKGWAFARRETRRKEYRWRSTSRASKRHVPSN
jgi:tetratricopeptide (TPR) repeat protein